MSEPEPIEPSQPAPQNADSDAAPFDSGPAGLPGCGKPAIIGCLVILVLLGVALLLLISQSPRILRWVMGQTRASIVQALPADLDPAERERLDLAFDSAIEALLEGRVDPSGLSNLQEVAGSVPKRGETLTREQVAEITRLLEEIAGVRTEPGAGRAPPSGPKAVRLLATA